MPGDATADQMDAIADLMDEFSVGEIRVTHEQNLVLPHVRKKRPARDPCAAEGTGPGHAQCRPDHRHHRLPGPGLLRPGQCPLHSHRPDASPRRFADLDRQHDIGELKIKISGCINACGHHHAGHIGILGVDKKGVEFYQLQLGGSGAEDASIGDIMGPGFGEHEIADAVERVVDVYLKERKAGERFLDTYRRIGMEPVQGRRLSGSSCGVTRLIKGGAFAARCFRARSPMTPPLPEGAVHRVAGALPERPRRASGAQRAHRRAAARPARIPEVLGEDVHRLSLVALEFPKFRDGRAFSWARMLRTRLGFTGEIRAVGDFLYDQINYQHRVGFDAWEVPDDFTIEKFHRALTEMTNVYQPSADGRKTIRELRAARVNSCRAAFIQAWFISDYALFSAAGFRAR